MMEFKLGDFQIILLFSCSSRFAILERRIASAVSFRYVARAIVWQHATNAALEPLDVRGLESLQRLMSQYYDVTVL